MKKFLFRFPFWYYLNPINFLGVGVLGFITYDNTVRIFSEIAQFEKAGTVTFNIEGETITVEVADVDIISEDIPGWLVSNEGNLTVALEVELTPELRKEGMARELINRIQNLRKETGLEITDRIIVTVTPCVETDEAIKDYADYIKSQVLADDIIIANNDGTETEFDDFKLNIKVEKK